MYDNREDPEKGDRPDFRCKNKECTGGTKGRPWAAYVKEYGTGRPKSLGEIFGVGEFEYTAEDFEEFTDEELETAGQDSLPF